MTDPTVEYPPRDGRLCCEHNANMHDRVHCHGAGCPCTRDAWVLRQQRAGTDSEGADEAPEGYSLGGVLVCDACGCVVGDTDQHTAFHATLALTSGGV